MEYEQLKEKIKAKCWVSNVPEHIINDKAFNDIHNTKVLTKAFAGEDTTLMSTSEFVSALKENADMKDSVKRQIKKMLSIVGDIWKLTYTSYRYKDVNGVEQTMFLIPDTRGAAIINTFAFAEEDGIPYDTKEITENGEKVLVNGRYVEFLGANGFERQFVPVAERNTILDTLAITKYNEATEYLENDLSRLSSEYYSLNGDCDTKTLSK